MAIGTKIKPSPTQTFSQAFDQLCTYRRAPEVLSDLATISANSLVADLESTTIQKRRYDANDVAFSKYPEEAPLDVAFGAMIDSIHAKPSQDFFRQQAEAIDMDIPKPYASYEAAVEEARELLKYARWKIARNGYLPIIDPHCGTGTFLIACADVLRQMGIDYGKSVLFIGQEKNRVAAQMCFVQLYCLDCPGYVLVNKALPEDLLRPKPSVNLYRTGKFQFEQPWMDRVERAIVRGNLRLLG